MQKQFIVYKGTEYTIECYWDSVGKSQFLEYFLDLDNEHKKKAFKLFELMGDIGKIHNIEKFRNEGDQIYAFKSSPNRYLCFFYKESKIIITNAFEKKTNKIPATEKAKAIRYKNDYIKRITEGSYYD